MDVAKCELLREPRVLSGDKVSRGNGLPDCEIYSIWLKFPELEWPFLEIHQHKAIHPRGLPKVNEPGYGHLSFQVYDIGNTLFDIVEAGGSQIGQTTNFGTPQKPYFFSYARDPEGNMLGLEQIAALVWGEITD